MVEICFLEMFLFTQLLVLNKFVLPRKQSACKFSIFMLGDNLFTHVITILLIIILKFKWYFEKNTSKVFDKIWHGKVQHKDLILKLHWRCRSANILEVLNVKRLWENALPYPPFRFFKKYIFNGIWVETRFLWLLILS